MSNNDGLNAWADWLRSVGAQASSEFPTSVVPAAVVLGTALVAASKILADAIKEHLIADLIHSRKDR